MANLIHNERVKLIATFCNNAGIASFAAGVLIPSFTVDPIVEGRQTAFLIGGIAIAAALVALGQIILGFMKDQFPKS